jgi:glycosyltransferase involved in cell wall biosynthesis
VAHKRIDRSRGLRRLRRFVESLSAEDVVVFTNLLPKITLDEAGYRKTPTSPVLIGQHHSSFHGQGSAWERGPRMRHFDDLDLFLALTEEDSRLFRSVVSTVCSSVPNVARALDHTRHRPERIAVALARYEREKRLDLMIRGFATATASDELRPWQLHLYGDGSLRSELAQLIEREGLGGRVELKGRTDEVEKVLETAAINLLTSEFEGFPMSVLEASAMGIPTVSFDCSPGVRALVSDRTGALVAPGDMDAYVTALRTLMTSAEEREGRGEVARASIGAFGEAAVVSRWFTLISECYQRRSEATALRDRGVTT